MPKFALKGLDLVKGKQQFDLLVEDGICHFEKFRDELEEQYESELATIIRYMEQVSKCKPIPETKFKDITPTGENVKEYEFKSKHLRVYAIKQKNGKIILIGGYKNSQKKDIVQFRALKKLYLKETG